MTYPVVRLPAELARLCEAYGQYRVALYAAGFTKSSCDVAYRSADKDAPLQANAKKGECGLCLYLGLDPERSLNWGAHPDAYDLVVPFNPYDARIDVKSTTLVGPANLIVSVGKNHFNDATRANIYAQAKVLSDEVILVGWISTRKFLESHRVKEEGDSGPRLDVGTKYLPESELVPIEELKRLLKRDEA